MTGNVPFLMKDVVLLAGAYFKFGSRWRSSEKAGGTLLIATTRKRQSRS
jgi:hypothetical protein